MQLAVVGNDGKGAGHVTVSDAVYSVPMNEHVVHSTLEWYLASRRRGTHAAKTRGEVSGGGKKPWGQKGTGRARAGSTRSPLWRKGGVIFPPKPRDYSFTLPKKVRKLALRVALSDKARAGRIKVVDELTVAPPKTKEMVKLLKGIGVAGRSLILVDQMNDNIERAARNIEGVKIMPASDLNIHDLLSTEWIVLDKKSAGKLEEVLK